VLFKQALADMMRPSSSGFGVPTNTNASVAPTTVSTLGIPTSPTDDRGSVVSRTSGRHPFASLLGHADVQRQRAMSNSVRSASYRLGAEEKDKFVATPGSPVTPVMVREQYLPTEEAKDSSPFVALPSPSPPASLGAGFIRSLSAAAVAPAPPRSLGGSAATIAANGSAELPSVPRRLSHERVDLQPTRDADMLHRSRSDGSQSSLPVDAVSVGPTRSPQSHGLGRASPRSISPRVPGPTPASNVAPPLFASSQLLTSEADAAMNLTRAALDSQVKAELLGSAMAGALFASFPLGEDDQTGSPTVTRLPSTPGAAPRK
jgi:hypothetical protein